MKKRHFLTLAATAATAAAAPRMGSAADSSPKAGGPALLRRAPCRTRQRFAMCPWGLYHVDVQA